MLLPFPLGRTDPTRNRYNITSSHVYRYTWFRIAKNGTRSMLAVLVPATLPETDGSWLRYSHRQHSGHFRFCFIRNPWDRLVSCYCNKVSRERCFKECWGRDFDYFVDYVAGHDLKSANRHFRLQTTLFPARRVDFVGRYEAFQRDFDYVINERLGLDKACPHRNASKRAPYTEYYTDRTRALVAERYRADIEFGGYTFGEERQPLPIAS